MQQLVLLEYVAGRTLLLDERITKVIEMLPAKWETCAASCAFREMACLSVDNGLLSSLRPAARLIHGTFLAFNLMILLDYLRRFLSSFERELSAPLRSLS